MIIGFLTSIVCASVMMSIVVAKNKNIIYPILIHQIVIFSLDSLYTGDLLIIFVPMAILYLLTTVVLVHRYQKFLVAYDDVRICQ